MNKANEGTLHDYMIQAINSVQLDFYGAFNNGHSFKVASQEYKNSGYEFKIEMYP